MKIVTDKDHADFCDYLQKWRGKRPGIVKPPKVDGALWFGSGLTFDEYADRYREELNSKKKTNK